MFHHSRTLTAIRWTFLLVLATGSVIYAQAPQKTKVPPKKAIAPVTNPVKGAKAVVAYNEFDAALKEYLAARTKAEAGAPPLPTKATAEQIAEHKDALAEELRKARPNAKQGDVFTPAVSKRIRDLFAVEFKGKSQEAKLVRNTVAKSEQLPDMSLHVGMAYPEKLPFETVPAGLLKRLPELPKDLQYRIVGHDFVLLDSVANTVIDFISDAKP